jgi:hypothetical protein
MPKGKEIVMQTVKDIIQVAKETALRLGYSISRTLQVSIDRPFAVFEIQHLSNPFELLVMKIQRMRGDAAKDDNARQGMLSEICFIRDLVPKILPRIQPKYLRKVKFPIFVAANERAGCPYLIEEELDGHLGGGIHWLDTRVITCDDLPMIVNVIEAINGFDVEETLALGPMIPNKTVNSNHWYEYSLNELTKEPYAVPLGETLDISERVLMASLLEANKRFLGNMGPPRVTAGDINPSNLLKLRDGRLGFIDWERLRITSSPVHDYSFLYIDLWTDRDLQREYFDMVMERNPSSNFFRMFALDVLYNRCIGENAHWRKVLKDPISDESQRAPAALEAVTATIRRILAGREEWEGVWS